MVFCKQKQNLYYPTLMTLEEFLSHFGKIYGKNNRIFYSPLEHVGFISAAIRNVQETLRKKPGNTRALEESIGGLIARIFAIATFYRKLPLNSGFCTKFPAGVCGDCQTSTCSCDYQNRPKHSGNKPPEEQFAWTLAQHQENMRAVYGQSNTEKGGTSFCFERLHSEAAELVSILIGSDYTGCTAVEIEKGLVEEISDVLAWTLSLAVQLNVDAQHVALHMYGNGCPICSDNPCRCQKFRIDPRNQIETARTQPA
ncbi:MAG: hypothetical protein V4686_01490 [Patescibacteria group bacterium]